MQLPQEAETVGNRFNYYIILSIPILAAKQTKYGVVQIAQHWLDDNDLNKCTLWESTFETNKAFCGNPGRIVYVHMVPMEILNHPGQWLSQLCFSKGN